MPWCNCDNNNDLYNVEVDQYTKDIRCSRCGSRRSDTDVVILLLHEVEELKNTIKILDLTISEMKREKEEREDIEFLKEIEKENEEIQALKNIEKGTERFSIMDL